MSYDTDLRELLRRHDGLSDTQITLALLMARTEQVYSLQTRLMLEGKEQGVIHDEFEKLEKQYLALLDVTLGIVRTPTAGVFPRGGDAIA